MHRSSTKWIALLSATVLAAMTVACGGGDEADEPSGGGGAAATTTQAAATEPDGEAREVELILKDNFFEPAEIRMKVGETVTIEAKNEGVAIHNVHVLSADTEGTDFRSDPLINPGDESKFDVKFSTAGTYVFQCDLHLPGMVGEIIVE